MAFNVTFPGQNANTGDTRAKFLTIFTGEVMAAFASSNIGMNTVKVNTISGGKTAQFIVTGKFSDSDVLSHTPGADVVTTALNTNEKQITITDKFYFASFLDKLEEKLSQFSIRGSIAKEHGEVLAKKIDKAIFKGIYDSRLVAPVGGQTASVVVTNTVIASATTNEAKGDAIVESIFAAQASLDANDVPAMDRVFVTNPTRKYQIVQSQKAINRDFNGGDNGSISSGNVMNIAGVSILASNNLPTLESDGTTATNLVGLLYTPEVYGVAKAMDITSESNYIPEKLGDLLVSYYALGMGTLNPACLAVIKSA